MEAVSNLFGVRGTAPDSISIVASPITAHDLNSGVFDEPLDHCLNFPIWQNINHFV